MRVPLLCLALLLAGCAAEPNPESLPGSSQSDVGVPYAEPSQTLRFAAEDFEQTQTYDGTFPVPNLCNVQQCNGQLVLIDLTPQVPADAPVELAITLSTSSCVDQRLVLDQAFIVRQSWVEDTLAAVVVREEAGKLQLELRHCSVLSLDETNGVAYDVEVRTVVRASLLPQYLPVRIELAVGDTLELTGPGARDVQTFVVVPPRQNPIHLEGATRFNVTADLPDGSYIVLVKGADTSLLGPNTTLNPVRIQVQEGDAQAVASDQATEWDVSVPGLPVWVSMTIGSSREAAEVSYSGRYALAVLQGTTILYEEVNDSCPAVCSFGLGALGYWTASSGSAFFGNDMQRGDLTFRVEAGPTMNVQATGRVGYITDA